MRRLLAGLLVLLALAACSANRVGGTPDRDREESAKVGPVDLRVPIELCPVTRQLPSGTPMPPSAAPPSGTVLPDADGNQLALRPAFLTLHRLDGGEIELDPSGDNWVILLRLTEQDGQTFATWTEEHVGEQVAVLADGEVIFAPQITGPITGGVLQIVGGGGGYTQDEANDVLNDITGH